MKKEASTDRRWGFRGEISVALILAALLTVGGPAFGSVQVAPGMVVTYPAPAGEVLSEDYEVQAGGRKVDVYTARVLDAPFAGKQWDYGGDYSFANFDMSGRVVVRIKSERSLRDVIIRPESYGIKAWLVDENTLEVTLEQPRKISIEPDGKKGPLLLFARGFK